MKLKVKGSANTCVSHKAVSGVGFDALSIVNNVSIADFTNYFIRSMCSEVTVTSVNNIVHVEPNFEKTLRWT